MDTDQAAELLNAHFEGETVLSDQDMSSALYYSLKELARLRARLDESDMLALRIEAERDELSARVAELEADRGAVEWGVRYPATGTWPEDDEDAARLLAQRHDGTVFNRTPAGPWRPA